MKINSVPNYLGNNSGETYSHVVVACGNHKSTKKHFICLNDSDRYTLSQETDEIASLTARLCKLNVKRICKLKCSVRRAMIH